MPTCSLPFCLFLWRCRILPFNLCMPGHRWHSVCVCVNTPTSQCLGTDVCGNVHLGVCVCVSLNFVITEDDITMLCERCCFHLWTHRELLPVSAASALSLSLLTQVFSVKSCDKATAWYLVKICDCSWEKPRNQTWFQKGYIQMHSWMESASSGKTPFSWRHILTSDHDWFIYLQIAPSVRKSDQHWSRPPELHSHFYVRMLFHYYFSLV